MIKVDIRLMVQRPNATHQEHGTAIDASHDTIELEDTVNVQKLSDCFTEEVLANIQSRFNELQDKHDNQCSILNIRFAFERAE